MGPAKNSHRPSSDLIVREWIPDTYSPGSRRKNNAIGDRKNPQDPTSDARAPASSQASSKELSCPICNKPFKDKWKLNDHLPAHSSEQTLQCERCPQRFKRQRDLKEHNDSRCSAQRYADAPTQPLRNRRAPKRSIIEVGGFVNETQNSYRQTYIRSQVETGRGQTISSQKMDSRGVNYLSNMGGSSADPIPQPHDFPSTIDGEEVPQVQIGREVRYVLSDKILWVVENLPGSQGTEGPWTGSREVGDNVGEISACSEARLSIQYKEAWNSGQSETVSTTRSSNEDNMTSIDDLTSNDNQQDEHHALSSTAPAMSSIPGSGVVPEMVPDNQSAAASIANSALSTENDDQTIESTFGAAIDMVKGALNNRGDDWADCEFTEPGLPPFFEELWKTDMAESTLSRDESDVL